MLGRENTPTATGIILAGGKNSRMGTNKAFIDFEGERLIDRTIRLFKTIFFEIILVTNEPLEYLDQDVIIVTDIYLEKGPLGGVYTGLFHASGSHAFVVACDMPFLNKAFIEYMWERIDRYDIVVSMEKEGYQPLHAIYAKSCLAPMKKLIMDNRLKLTDLYRGRKILALSEETARMFDPKGTMFFNINSPEDLSQVSST